MIQTRSGSRHRPREFSLLKIQVLPRIIYILVTRLDPYAPQKVILRIIHSGLVSQRPITLIAACRRNITRKKEQLKKIELFCILSELIISTKVSRKDFLALIYLKILYLNLISTQGRNTPLSFYKVIANKSLKGSLKIFNFFFIYVQIWENR